MGNFGGLATFWDPCKIFPLGWLYSPLALFVVSFSFDSNEVILITNLYVPMDFVVKVEHWSHIQYAKKIYHFNPWVLVGDFNLVLSLKEKRCSLS